jgi:hypothetical protein
MLIPAARERGRQVSQTASLPPPTGGWNARDALFDMPQEDAVQLDNYIPASANATLRNGSLKYSYYVGQLTAFTRSTTGTYFDSVGTLKTDAIDVPRYTWYTPAGYGTKLSIEQLWIDVSYTNSCLFSRDLSNAAWTKSNLTAVKNAVGLDGVSNSASTLTASAANGTAKQAITITAGQFDSFYIKRLTGTGAFAYTLDGSTWITVIGITTSYIRVESAAAGLNPTIGFRISVSGDAFIVDCNMLTSKTNAMPVNTTSGTVTSGADTPSYSSGSSYNAVGVPIETLFSYASGATTSLMAAAGGGIYDCTNGGPVGLPLLNGFTSNRWQYENMNGYLLAFNGGDTPQKYNGSWANNTITGLSDSTKLIYPCLFKHRLWMVESGTLSAWYLDTDAISGAATQFDLSLLCHKGGYLVAIGVWTRDGGAGSDDFILFYTNKGEVLMYQGTDPASSTTFALVGVFQIGAPVGNRPLVQYGSDLVVISEDGFLPMSKALPLARDAAEKVAISDKIRQAATDGVTSYKANFGWEALLYPDSNWLLFNVPVISNSTVYQYVMNTLNNSWCRFIGLNASCWTLYKQLPYFASSNGFVCQADSGMGDDNLSYTASGLSYINGEIVTAFNYFKTRSSKKQFKAVRPVISSSVAVKIALSINVDFESKVTSPVNTPASGGSSWDTSPWDTTPWGNSNIIRKSWLTAHGNGYCAAAHLVTSTNGVSIALNSIDWLYERGGVM